MSEYIRNTVITASILCTSYLFGGCVKVIQTDSLEDFYRECLEENESLKTENEELRRLLEDKDNFEGYTTKKDLVDLL